VRFRICSSRRAAVCEPDRHAQEAMIGLPKPLPFWQAFGSRASVSGTKPTLRCYTSCRVASRSRPICPTFQAPNQHHLDLPVPADSSVCPRSEFRVVARLRGLGLTVRSHKEPRRDVPRRRFLPLAFVRLCLRRIARTLDFHEALQEAHRRERYPPVPGFPIFDGTSRYAEDLCKLPLGYTKLCP
jgi:hypothetical protein